MREPVHLTAICHRYGRLTSLTDVTLTLEPGQVTALVGGNGSGKSTLLGLLAGTLRPSSGTRTGLPSNTALVPQHSSVPELFPVTVRDTVSMGRWRTRGLLRPLRRADHLTVRSAMERMEVTSLADRTLADLSGGQTQRALIAQGLAQQAPLLLLDEPLSAVDSSAVTLIDRAIRQECDAGATVVIATHHQHQADGADHVILLEDGRRASGLPPRR